MLGKINEINGRVISLRSTKCECEQRTVFILQRNSPLCSTLQHFLLFPSFLGFHPFFTWWPPVFWNKRHFITQNTTKFNAILVREQETHKLTSATRDGIWRFWHERKVRGCEFEPMQMYKCDREILFWKRQMRAWLLFCWFCGGCQEQLFLFCVKLKTTEEIFFITEMSVIYVHFLGKIETK